MSYSKVRGATCSFAQQCARDVAHVPRLHERSVGMLLMLPANDSAACLSRAPETSQSHVSCPGLERTPHPNPTHGNTLTTPGAASSTPRRLQLQTPCFVLPRRPTHNQLLRAAVSHRQQHAHSPDKLKSRSSISWDRAWANRSPSVSPSPPAASSTPSAKCGRSLLSTS